MTAILIVLILLLIFSGPWHPYSRDWGYGPSGAFGIVVMILLILLLLGKL